MKTPSHLWMLSLVATLALGCMSEPGDYEDPDTSEGDVTFPVTDGDPAPDVTVTPDAQAPPSDAPPSDVAEVPTDIAPEEVATAEDTTQAPEDTTPAPEDVTQAPEDAGQTPEEVAQAATCLCSFQLAATQPLVQDYVLITGDFLEPEWPDSMDDGALALALNAAGDTWEIAVSLTDLTDVQYKYLAGWSDNPGPEWRGPNGATDGDNGHLYVICGQAPCESAE